MLRDIHDEYRRALEAARGAESPEALQAAQDDVIVKRHALDAALIEAEEARELDCQVAAAEAREAAIRKTTDVAAKYDSGLPVDAIRAFAKGEGPAINTTLEFRTDITNEASTTYGSYLVPQSWASSVVDFQIASSGVLKAKPTILNTASGNQINMPILVTDATSAAGAEGTAATQSNVVWGTAPLNAYRFDGYFSVSNELLADSGVALEPLLAKYAARSIAAKINPYFADPDVGTGSSTIAAIQIGATHGKTAASYSVAPTLDEQKELMLSVLPEYRMGGGAAFVVNSATYLATALARDDTGNFIWQPSNTAAEPDRLWGYPYIEDAYMDSLATGNEPAIFGDVGAAYMVRYGHGGMQFIVSKEFAVTSFETTFIWGLWADACTVDTLAVKTIILP